MSNGDIPSPAASSPMQAQPATRNGLSALPWESALFAAVSSLEAQLDACRKENAQLHRDIAQLNTRLYSAQGWARRTSANWKLRQDAWRRERAELLARIGKGL